MPDYSNGKIYKLVSDKTDMIYIGSTTVKLYDRLSNHKNDFTKNHGSKTSKKLFELGGVVSIELIKLFPCDCKKELEKEEGKYIREYKNICVNERIAGRTKKEYTEDNKEIKKEYDKKYREKNKKKRKENAKKYNENNKEKIKEKNKKRYENNKEIIKEKNKEKYLCECGSEILKCTKARHEISIKHISFINNNK
jgi:hypothetical protein